MTRSALKVPRKQNTKDRSPGEVLLSARSATLREKPKRGRRTIPDNFLAGSRNAWAALLEESWLQVGWPLLCIRDRRKSTIEDLRKALEPLKGMPHNSGLAAALYRQSYEAAKPAEVLKNREKVGKLDAEILQAQAKRDEYIRSCAEAEAALKVASPGEMDTIQDEALRRLQRLLHLADDLKKLGVAHESLYEKSLDQEAYVFCSELLDFLLSRRYAVSPQNLASALAGLPGMRWRQSFARSSGMPFNEPRSDYRVFKLISLLCDRLPQDAKGPSQEVFKARLLKLSPKLGYTRQFLWDNWRDLRRAIEECWKLQAAPPGSIPFVLASIFMRNVAEQKNPAARVLAEREKLQGAFR